MILTISFKDGSNPAKELTLEQLKALPKSAITTRTPWHDGEQNFEGVALSDLMDFAGAKGGNIHVFALNGYETELPFSDFAEHGPILAYQLNGAPMSIEQKGPLFIIYGFDDKPELNSELYFSRSAWQVRSMTIE